MTDPVDGYLAKLKDELSGADPATIQDALADAEDHLRTGLAQLRSQNPDLSDEDALRQVVDAYGAPADIGRSRPAYCHRSHHPTMGTIVPGCRDSLVCLSIPGHTRLFSICSSR